MRVEMVTYELRSVLKILKRKSLKLSTTKEEALCEFLKGFIRFSPIHTDTSAAGRGHRYIGKKLLKAEISAKLSISNVELGNSR